MCPLAHISSERMIPPPKRCLTNTRRHQQHLLVALAIDHLRTHPRQVSARLAPPVLRCAIPYSLVVHSQRLGLCSYTIITPPIPLVFFAFVAPIHSLLVVTQISCGVPTYVRRYVLPHPHSGTCLAYLSGEEFSTRFPRRLASCSCVSHRAFRLFP